MCGPPRPRRTLSPEDLVCEQRSVAQPGLHVLEVRALPGEPPQHILSSVNHLQREAGRDGAGRVGAGRQASRQAGRQAGEQAGRQAGEQAGRQVGRQ